MQQQWRRSGKRKEGMKLSLPPKPNWWKNQFGSQLFRVVKFSFSVTHLVAYYAETGCSRPPNPETLEIILTCPKFLNNVDIVQLLLIIIVKYIESSYVGSLWGGGGNPYVLLFSQIQVTSLVTKCEWCIKLSMSHFENSTPTIFVAILL